RHDALSDEFCERSAHRVAKSTRRPKVRVTKIGTKRTLSLSLPMVSSHLAVLPSHPLTRRRTRNHPDSDAGDKSDPDKRASKPRDDHAERVFGHPHGYRDRHRNDLGADNVVQLPTKAVGCAIEPDHLDRGLIRCAVALQTADVAHFDRS